MRRWLSWCAVLVLLVPAGLSAGEEYLIGGGDTLQVNVWKNPEFSQTVVVRPDGQITLPLIRDVRAAGLSATQLAKVLTEKLSAFVNAPNVTVTVAAATSFKVYTQGAIVNGVFSLQSSITARQLLAQVGGPGPNADLQGAFVLRGEARIPVDLGIPRRGDKSPGVDLPLVRGDVLAVPLRDVTLGRVLIVGEVAQPHAQPYAEGMTFLDAYLGAGGGTASADLKNAKVARLQKNGSTLEIPVDIEEMLKRGALQQNIALAPGDIVIVPFRPIGERIIVVGEVQTPRALAFREGLTVLDAYVEAGGGTQYADLGAVKVVRTVDGKKQDLRVDLERMLKKADLARNLALFPGDIVMVPR